MGKDSAAKNNPLVTQGLSQKWYYFILAAVCVIVYANSLRGEFVSDDIPGIVKSQLISRPQDYILAFSPLFHSLTYLVARLNPVPYHIVSVVLHALNSVLAFLFLRKFFKVEAAFLGGLLFACHPIHAEAVAWISGIPYLVLGIFIFLCFLFYERALRNQERFHKGYYFLSLGLFAYYLICNYSFFTLFPFLLVIFDMLLGRCRRAWKFWMPFIFLVGTRVILAKAAIFSRLNYVVKEMGLNQPEWSNPFFNMVYSFFAHSGLLLWPAKLTLYHEPAVISSTALTVGIIGLLFLALSAPFLFWKAKELFLALGIFFIFLAPTYSPVPLGWLFAERYVYFSTISLSIVLAFVYEKYSQKCPNRKQLATVVFLLIVFAYAARTVARNEDWKTPGRLWRQTVEASDLSPRAHNNMGDAYGQEQNTAGSIKEFKRAIELKPDYADAYHNLANTYEGSGNSDEAMGYYKEAIKYNPNLFESYFNLGLIYLRKGQKTDAEYYLRRAKELRPEDQGAATALNLAIQ